MKHLSPDRWQQIDRLMAAALEQPAGERLAWLRRHCGADEALCASVAALLTADEEAERRLGESITEFAGPLLPGLQEQLASVLEPDLAPGSRIGPYRIERQIGRGGMGAVYLAERDGDFRQRVALKVVKRGMDTDEILRRFRHERRILARLEHPHIARLLDGGATPDGRPYLVVEYVEGQPITAYCDARRLDVDARLRLFEKVCEAVRYAHASLVVHRDLKPSNILVTDAGEVKLLDFGIARLLREDDASTLPLTRTGQRLLTPAYAAPEQLRGEPVTTAADVYGLGVVLYELLTGRRPSGADGQTATAPEPPSTAVTRQTQAGEAADPGTVTAARRTTPPRLRRRLRGDLDTMLLTALRPEPVRRYASADAFLDDIRRHLEGLPIRARRDTLGYRARSFVRRHRFGVGAGAAAVAMLVAFAVAMTLQQRATAAERDRAHLEAEKAQQVASFLESLLASADPFAPERLDTLRVQDLLARGVARLDADLAGQPLVQAHMLGVVGRVYQQLARYDEAEPLLRRALETRAAQLGPHHLDTAESLFHLAAVRSERGALDEAEALSRQALQIRQSAPGAEQAVAESMKQLGYVLAQRGRLAGADSLYRQALALDRRAYGDAHAEIASGLSMLASLREDQGAHAEAESLYAESIAVRRRLYGDAHPSLAVGLNNLAVLLRNQQRYDEAEPLIREALAINRAALGPDHVHTIDNVSVLASVLRGRGDAAAAEVHFLEALDRYRRTLGPMHPSVSITLSSYAPLLEAQGRFDEAEQALRTALDISRAAFGDEHFSVFITRTRLAGLSQARGDLDAARRRYEEALALGSRLLPADNLHLVLARMKLGTCLAGLRRYDEAEPLLRDSHETLRATHGDESGFTVAARKHLAALYDAWNRPEMAAPFR